jgi:GTPase SAR1 family protein
MATTSRAAPQSASITPSLATAISMTGETNYRFHVVIIGSGPVGKTSLVNALLGRSVGETGATIGTSRRGATYTHEVAGLEGTLFLTDTPALGAPGPEGNACDALALELASQADLVLLVVDHDLSRADRLTLLGLSDLGKRVMVVFNKKDRFTEDDRIAIETKLRERLQDVVGPEDIVAVAADPSPVSVRVRKLDGTTETVLEVERPDLQSLEDRLATVLAVEGEALRAGNILLRARLREQSERTELARQRRQSALALVERYQWVAAATAFANPILLLGPMAVGAVQLQMLSELARAYGVTLSAESVAVVGRQMAQTLFKLGIFEAVASVLGGLLKFNPLGFAAGGLVQGATMAYLTRLTGESFLEYLEAGQTWGDAGIEGALSRHLAASHASGWFLQFAKSFLSRYFKQ